MCQGPEASAHAWSYLHCPGTDSVPALGLHTPPNSPHPATTPRLLSTTWGNNQVVKRSTFPSRPVRARHSLRERRRKVVTGPALDWLHQGVWQITWGPEPTLDPGNRSILAQKSQSLGSHPSAVGWDSVTVGPVHGPTFSFCTVPSKLCS